MNDSRLQIRRVHAQYLVPSDHPAPGHIKDRLDNEIRRSLSQVLSAAFSTWFSETDSSLWFVRQLEIDLAINAASNGEGVSRTFTRQLGRALGDTLQDTDQNNVVRFSSPADYLARFLSDLAAGDAWGRWYYESFFGLRMLPTSAVLRTAVCSRPDTGKDALLLLSKNELRDVLRALNRQDARLILESLTSGLTDESEFDLHEMASTILRLVEPDLLAELNEWGQALYLYLSVARHQEEAGLDETHAVLLLLRCSHDRLRDIAEDLQTVEAEVKAAETERRYTSFGGAFLLLPLLDEIPLEEALHNWPHSDEAAAISLVRFLVLIKCSGPKHAQHTLTNSLLRDLMLVPPSVSADVLTEWQSRVATKHMDSFLKTLTDWQRQLGRSNDRDISESDLSYLALPGAVECSSALDLALSVTAHNLLRNFAWRLPGFAESNLPYLANNFLDFPASVEEEPTRRIVRLSGPPLRLVLGITGMMRQTYRLSWLDERPLTLFEES